MHNENSSNIYNENVEVNFVEMDYYEIEFDKIEFPVNLSEMNFSKSEISIYTKQDAFEKGNLIIEELHSKGKNKNKYFFNSHIKAFCDFICQKYRRIISARLKRADSLP